MTKLDTTLKAFTEAIKDDETTEEERLKLAGEFMEEYEKNSIHNLTAVEWFSRLIKYLENQKAE